MRAFKDMSINMIVHDDRRRVIAISRIREDFLKELALELECRFLKD